MTGDGIRWISLENQFSRINELVDGVDRMVGTARREASEGELERRDVTDIIAEVDALVKELRYFGECVLDSLSFSDKRPVKEEVQ